MRAAVVGHLEWVEFLRVERLPGPGDIVPALERWEEPAGGGTAAAMQLHKLCGDAAFFTALGEDEVGRRATTILEAEGLRVHAAPREGPTRRAVTHVDASGERTITVVGARLEPSDEDPLPWSDLSGANAVYFTAGDAGALRRARAADVLVATSRVFPLLARSGAGRAWSAAPSTPPRHSMPRF